LILWWPVFLPLVALIFAWPKLHPAVKTIIVVLPIAFLGMEIYTVGGRPDSTSKVWGYIFGAGWITLFPTLCLRRGFLFRGLTCLLIVSSLFSFIAWAQYTSRLIVWNEDAFRLEGTGVFRTDPLRGNLLQAISQMKGQTLITGRSWDMYCETPVLAAFTGNRVYVNWSFFCDSVAGGNTYGQANLRGKEVNDLYDGKCPDPLLFLRTHDIAALVIYPGDKIGTDIIANLKKQLSPSYEYDDFSDADTNSGIFIFRPQMVNWPAENSCLQPPLPSNPESLSGK
jgi:hypothetical protein